MATETEYGYSYFFAEPYIDKSAQFQKLRDCFDGNEKIKAGGTVYLPRPSGFPANTDGDNMYAAYKQRSLYYPVVERTLRALLGIVFRVDPRTELPDALQDLVEAITPEGDSLIESVRTTVLQALHMGRHGLLLDLPVGERTDARPYISHYIAEDITNWRRQVVNAKLMVTRVMLRDMRQDGDANNIHRFRELYLDLSEETPVYRQKCWKCIGDGKAVKGIMWEDITPQISGQPLEYIPFVFVGPYSNKPELEKSPLLDLCDVSIKHYQIGADLYHALYMLSAPTPVLYGGDAADVPTSIGAGALVHLPETARFDFLEYSGAGVGSLQDEREKLEGHMAALGAKLIHRQRQQETAEAVMVKARDEISVVESTVMSVSDAYELLLEWAAQWLGADPEQVSFEMHRDFIERKMDSAMLGALIKAHFDDKAISREVYHLQLQKGEIIPADRTIEEEEAAGATGKDNPTPPTKNIPGFIPGQQPPPAPPAKPDPGKQPPDDEGDEDDDDAETD